MSSISTLKENYDQLGQDLAGEEARARQQVGMRTLPAEMATAVAQLMLLYGIPFAHLVPDWRMLPPHAIRFFHLDANWLDSLLDGAFSIGVHSQRDRGHQTALTPIIRLAAAQAAPDLRPSFQEDVPLGEITAVNAAETTQLPSLDWCGFLLRSPVVAGWPGLEICGYNNADVVEPGVDPETREAAKIPLLRLERLAPDIMLGIFPQVPAAVAIYEPAEGLHFGLRDDHKIELRDSGTGKLDQDSKSVNMPPSRPGAAPGVLNIQQLHQILSAAVPVADGNFGPADFALQMITAARMQVFKPALNTEGEI
jgi:hypothetical protein